MGLNWEAEEGNRKTAIMREEVAEGNKKKTPKLDLKRRVSIPFEWLEDKIVSVVNTRFISRQKAELAEALREKGEATIEVLRQEVKSKLAELKEGKIVEISTATRRKRRVSPKSQLPKR